MRGGKSLLYHEVFRVNTQSNAYQVHSYSGGDSL
jgi:hypothetical protein